jgi:hypothetical protein
MSATVDRQTLVTYLDQLLDAGRGRDYGPNGLQVEGKAEIRNHRQLPGGVVMASSRPASHSWMQPASGPS